MMTGAGAPAAGTDAITAVILVKLQERLSKHLVVKMASLLATQVEAVDGGAGRRGVLECNAVCSETDVVILACGDRARVGALVMEATEPMRYMDSSQEEVVALARSVTPFVLHPEDPWEPRDEGTWDDSRIDAYVLIDLKEGAEVNRVWKHLKKVCDGRFLGSARLKDRPTLFARVTAPDKRAFDHTLLSLIQPTPGVQATRSFVILRDEATAERSGASAPPRQVPVRTAEDEFEDFPYKDRLLLKVYQAGGASGAFVPFRRIHLQEKWRWAKQLADPRAGLLHYRLAEGGKKVRPLEVGLTPRGVRMAESLLRRPRRPEPDEGR